MRKTVVKLLIALLSLPLALFAVIVISVILDPKLKLAKDTAQEIMNCFINEDEEALYSILSEDAKDFSKTKSQIKNAFEFIDGDIVSYELPTSTGAGGKDRKDGKIMAEMIEPRIAKIETSSDEIYEIMFQYRLVNEYKKESEGLDAIVVYLKYKDTMAGFIEKVEIGFDSNEWK